MVDVLETFLPKSGVLRVGIRDGVSSIEQSSFTDCVHSLIKRHSAYLCYLMTDWNHVWMAVCCLADCLFWKSVWNLILNHLGSRTTYKMTYEAFGMQNFRYRIENRGFQQREKIGILWEGHPLGLTLLNVLGPNITFSHHIFTYTKHK